MLNLLSSTATSSTSSCNLSDNLEKQHCHDPLCGPSDTQFRQASEVHGHSTKSDVGFRGLVIRGLGFRALGFRV